MVKITLALAFLISVDGHGDGEDHKMEMAALHRRIANLECSNSVLWYKNGDSSKDCTWVAKWPPRCGAKGWDKSSAAQSCPLACHSCVVPEADECPSHFSPFEPTYGSNLYDSVKTLITGSGAETIDPSPTVAIHAMGSITALIPEASDAMNDESLIVDGQSGDVDFPHGNMKPLATVGELFNGLAVAGVPDGMGAYLLDADTVRLVVQSESYGFISGYESYPWFAAETPAQDQEMAVNSGQASYTGSHVQYADVDRSALASFMMHEHSAEYMIKDLGNLIETTVNLKGEFVLARNRDGPTTVGAHFSNTDADGNYVLAQDAKYADWVMQSLCSAYLTEPESYGAGIGSADRIYMTNEEWITYAEGVTAVVGIGAHAVDISNKIAYAVGVFTQGGFEKIVEIDPGHEDYVAWAISGYNGAFSSDSMKEATITRRAAMSTRADGKDWVWPRDIVPARVYIGKKGYNENGEMADDFLSRNGLRYGKVYGFATDTSSTGYRDAWHQENFNGATVDGAFVAVDWSWDGVVQNFEYDGSWDFQDAPPAGPSGYEYWTAAGPDASGAKTEHLSPFNDGTSSYVQGSTAGYFGKYTLTDLGTVLASSSEDFPASVDATYTLYQGETDVNTLIDLGGKGLYAGGYNATQNFDRTDLDEEGNVVVESGPKNTFEDVDGLEVIHAADGDYLIFQEDSGNDLGDRMFITKLQTEADMDYKFIAFSGGKANTRMAAGVGIPAGSNIGGNSHEFSGIVDLSGMVATDSSGNFLLDPVYIGADKLAANKAVPINEKVILIGLQAHNMVAGSVYLTSADRGGQWLIYQPSI